MRVNASNSDHGNGRRRQIVAVAADLFDSVGYSRASMLSIAEAVGVSKATLYHYFDSKDSILYWIHEEFIDLLIDRHETRLSTPMPSSQLLLEVMADVLELMETHRGYVRVFFEHRRELPAAEQRVLNQKRDRYFDEVLAVIERGQESGEFVTSDARLTTLAVFGMCNWAYQWYQPQGPLRTRDIAYHFWALMLHGLTPIEPPSGGLPRSPRQANHPTATSPPAHP